MWLIIYEYEFIVYLCSSLHNLVRRIETIELDVWNMLKTKKGRLVSSKQFDYQTPGHIKHTA